MLVAVLSTAVGACGIITGPSVELDFSVTGRSTSEDELVQAQGDVGSITAEGTIWRGACQTLTAQADRHGRDLELIVSSVPVEPYPPACPDVIYMTSYRAILGDLDPGEYHLTVRHDNRGPADPVRAAYDGMVVVG